MVVVPEQNEELELQTILQQSLVIDVPVYEMPQPWFGIDIGGTLTKLAYFDPQPYNDLHLTSGDDLKLGKAIRRYLLNNRSYGKTGIRDDYLQLNDVNINGQDGSIHFIRFPTEDMLDFIRLVKSKGFIQLSSTICATGGGAYKYAKQLENELNLKLHKSDELESLIKGIEIATECSTSECYYFDCPLSGEDKVVWRWQSGRCSRMDYKFVGTKEAENLQYPYILCNIGSGVSMVLVNGRDDFQRVSGSSIAGGFFHGLCSLLCGANSFEEAIELATRGDNKSVDKLVGDIYGSEGYDKIGLDKEIVAASFGKAIYATGRNQMSKEDLARSALVTTANNIASIALNSANQYNINRIVFAGNFLRVNPLAARLLAHAMNFWSNGSKKALFLRHEGYFGAIGCLEKLVEVSHQNAFLSPEHKE